MAPKKKDLWVRFDDDGRPGFGRVDGAAIAVHDGDMFTEAAPTGRTVALDTVSLLTPTVPGKMIALWNNFHALATKASLTPPAEPLYFIKADTSYAPTGAVIRRPPGYDGKVVYEGELGIVIGQRAERLTEDAAAAAIFGFTCINDVTAIGIIDRDPTFAQWTRAKSFPGFGAFGPAVATGLDPGALNVRTMLNGNERQNYPVSDMIHPPTRIVSMISQDVTLLPGDIICCGTSVGVGSMKEPENLVEVAIDGIGTLSNRFVQT
jgi:2-keto-4-pentenoate hydratase/2-oxohepta-3-ene-1,7-dioic acid hydratase in catechol pathway